MKHINSDATKRCRPGGTGEDDGRGGAGGGGEASGSDCEVEDIVGRRKHALAVEIPRTVLFRLVGWFFIFRLEATCRTDASPSPPRSSIRTIGVFVSNKGSLDVMEHR